MASRFLIILAITLCACIAEPRQEGDSAAAAATADSGARSDAGTSTPSMATSGRVLDDDCDPDTTTRHPEPVALVREFIERDGHGEFASGSEWLVESVLCPGHLPGPDTFTAIDTMSLVPGAAVITSDSARIPVRYRILGDASASGFFPDNPERLRILVDTFVVVRMPYGWRIVEPSMPMRIRAAVALEWEWIGDSTRADLRAAATAARAARQEGGGR